MLKMKQRINKARLVGLLVLIVLLINVFPVYAATQETTVIRLYGENRYLTATAIADTVAQKLDIDYAKGQQFQCVVLASGNDWPDAIVGAPLAVQNKAPILLLDTTAISDYSQITWNYVNTHVAKSAKVYILGGKGVMPQEMTNKLVAMGYSQSNIKQLGGPTRIETSVLIAKEIKINIQGVVLAVSGDNFHDALIANSSTCELSKYVENNQTPMVLVSNVYDSSVAIDYLRTVKVPSVAGGASAFVKKLLPNVYIFYEEAQTVYETNGLFGVESSHQRDSAILLTRGDLYPDALTGSVLAGVQPGNGFILLTDSNELQSATIKTLKDLAYWEHGNPNLSKQYPVLYVLGGPGAVSDSVVNSAKQILDTDGESATEHI